MTRIVAGRFQATLLGTRWVVTDPQGQIVMGPCGHAQAVQEAGRLNADLAARQKRGPRPCMRCGAEFVSDGIHHRLCNPCKHSGVDYLGAYGLAGGEWAAVGDRDCAVALVDQGAAGGRRNGKKLDCMCGRTRLMTAYEFSLELCHRQREMIDRVRNARSVPKVMLLLQLERLESDLGKLSAMLSVDTDMAGCKE